MKTSLANDREIFNFLVKQWFFVYKKSEFLDQKFSALNHIIDLTGTRPKHFESPQKFLARVLLPEDGSVKVALGGNKADNNKKKSVDKNNIDPDSAIREGKNNE